MGCREIGLCEVSVQHVDKRDVKEEDAFNLRGNCRTSGELRQREGGGIFGLGSRTPIAITILVKKGAGNTGGTGSAGNTGRGGKP